MCDKDARAVFEMGRCQWRQSHRHGGSMPVMQQSRSVASSADVRHHCTASVPAASTACAIRSSCLQPPRLNHAATSIHSELSIRQFRLPV